MIAIAQSKELEEGGTLRFRIPWEGAEREAFVLRRNGRVLAYLNRCTHRDLPLDLGSGEFFRDGSPLLVCQAHRAFYDPESGACSDGPCPKGSSLTRVEVWEEGGTIYAEGRGTSLLR